MVNCLQTEGAASAGRFSTSWGIWFASDCRIFQTTSLVSDGDHIMACGRTVCCLVSTQDVPDGMKTIIRRDGYVVVENELALPQAFVPQAIRLVDDGQELIGSAGR